MQRFFDRPDTRWPSLRGCLHVYAVPGDEDPIRHEVDRMQGALAPIRTLGLQPPSYLHATIQRLLAYEQDLISPAWRVATEAIGRAVAAHPPFQLEFAPPVASSHAVEAISEPMWEWTSLIVTVRAAIADAGLAAILTEPPVAPHYTLAYGLADVADADVSRALSSTAVRTRFEVARVILAAVDQDPVGGAFWFRRLQDWALTG